MAELIREQSQYRKAKTPIISKYRDEHAQLMSAIAGRGFDRLPGYAYEDENKIELTAKMSLSEVNYKILSETIERELKQAGIDYDLAYKTALLAWEVEKQALMAAWDAELQGIKQGMASEEEVLNQLEIEVGKRSIILLEGKTAIELEMEAYRETLAELDSAVSPYEVQLANAKLLTAQKKLGLLPIIQTIITKEQELLAVEQGKAAAYTALIDAENQVSEKKKDLIAPLGELATVSEEYAGRIGKQVVIEGQIADEKIKQFNSAMTKAGYQVDEITANIATENKRIILANRERDLKDARFTYEEGLLTHETDLTDYYQNTYDSYFDSDLANQQAMNATIISNKEIVNETNNDTKLTSAKTIASGENYANRGITTEQIRGDQTIAQINAQSSNITATLNHIIG